MFFPTFDFTNAKNPLIMLNKITLLMLLFATISSCTVETTEDLISQEITTEINTDRLVVNSDGPVFCTEVDLIAGQNYDAGNVSVSKDGDNLIITYQTEGDWTLDATHLYVGDCELRPANNPGNPLIGHFPYAASHPAGTTTYTYTIDTSNMPDCICIAAHAEVSSPNGSETAWADGEPYGGNSWAMYFSYCLSQCGVY
jgi:hypothetical protein